ncbi:MAG: ATP-dependent DNA helicase RecG [Candidatus Falkowbacteria bacterium]
MDTQTSIESLPKVGKASAPKLRKLDIRTVADLLGYYPFRYDDFTETKKINQLKAGERCNITGTVEMIDSKRSPRKRISITEALISDDSDTIKAVWFNQPFIATTIKAGDQLSISGKVDEDFAGLYFSSPSYEKIVNGLSIHTQGLIPNYPLTAGLTQKQLRFWIKEAIQLAGELPEWLPDEMLKRYNLSAYNQAILQVHFPKNQKDLDSARHRLAFDELLLVQYRSQLVKLRLEQTKAKAIEFQEEATRKFVASLPFALTTGQRQAAWEILQDLAKDKPMMRLLQGDVGSGKTIVAVIAMLNVVLNNRQAALMAPTEILAKQHYQSISRLLMPLGIRVGLLTGSDKKYSQSTDGKKIKADKIVKEAQVIIGTHALIQADLEYPDLALVIIDEQHRFGVEQRQALSDKAKASDTNFEPHLLSMTATPIPRTLALSLYDDLAVSLIPEMPKNRLPIITEVVADHERHRAYGMVAAEISAGRQAFVICPLIDPADNFGTKSVKEEYERLKNDPAFANIEIGLLHGKLTPKAKDQVMADFASGQIQLIVATAVVEVGVDVPNATVMLIESAESFGLAQLHQYRGRVGRGAHQSYCYLLAGDLSDKSRQRLEAMTKYNSGFALAQEDLKFRGPGEVYGTVQKGFPELKIASLFDFALMQEARDAARWLATNCTQTELASLNQKLAEISNKAHLE